uniref:Uncharacterized protein n=1 Tax=Arundo donax TaxID=35708 RepID=A0A0A9AZV4_ARUDO
MLEATPRRAPANPPPEPRVDRPPA